MAVKNVEKMGSTLLLARSEVVTEFGSVDLNHLIQNMIDTMQEKGGIGIAAPQIGCNKRVIMFGFDKSPRYPNELPVPFTILINPEIEISTDEMVDGWEGCLSVPGLRGLVPRFTKIKYKGFDEKGKVIERIVENFHARMVQHEYDHINGVLFPHRIKDLRNFGFDEIILDKIRSQTGFTII
jgi:peptide deformylase